MKRVFKVLGIVVLILIGLAIALRLALQPMALKIANDKLPGLLGTDAALERIDLSLTKGQFGLSGISVQQPEGFEGDPLLTLGRVSAWVDKDSLSGDGEVIIKEVRVADLSVHVIKNAEGEMNVEQLGPPKENTEAETDTQDQPQAEAPTPEDSKPSKESEAMRPLRIEEITLDRLNIHYTDYSFGEAPLDLRITELNVALTNVVIDEEMATESVMPTGGQLTAKILQKDQTPAHLGLSFRLGALGSDIPAANAALRLIGLELDTLAAVLPPGVASVLGGECLDLHADASVSPEVLSVDAHVLTAVNNLGLRVGGTPEKPEVDKSGILFALAMRSTGSIGGLADNLTGTGLETGEAALSTATTLGAGAGKTIGHFGKSLFKTAKGIATLDMDEVGQGLKDSTLGTVQKAETTVTDTANEAATGLGETMDAVSGTERENSWRSDITNRWEGQWNIAQDWVAAQPYPSAK